MSDERLPLYKWDQFVDALEVNKIITYKQRNVLNDPQGVVATLNALLLRETGLGFSAKIEGNDVVFSVIRYINPTLKEIDVTISVGDKE